VDEFNVILRARPVCRPLTANHVGLPIEAYFAAMNGLPEGIIVRFDDTLGPDEAGHTVAVAGRQCIVINANDRPERQRFTACHEVAHILLGLPTEHERGGSDFARRSPNETLCDVFAAELLLPSHLFQPLVEDVDIGFAAVEKLSGEFVASLAATGSRFATVCDRPCAFVLIQDGAIRYTSRSKSLRECGAWVRPSQRVPQTSMAGKLIRSEAVDGPIEVAAEEWFDDWKRRGVVWEEARHSARLNQTLALLWFDDDRVPSSSSEEGEDEELALQPLDGVLPWPGKHRRRR
jgi:hypothetical protein